MVRDSFVQKTRSTIQGLTFPSSMDTLSLTRFQEQSRDILANLKSLSPKQLVLLSRYYKDTSAPVISELRLTCFMG